MHFWGAKIIEDDGWEPVHFFGRDRRVADSKLKWRVWFTYYHKCNESSRSFRWRWRALLFARWFVIGRPTSHAYVVRIDPSEQIAGQID